jgi:peptidylprolyl isomerase
MVAALAVVVALFAAGCGSESLTGKVVKDAGTSCVQPKSIPAADGKPTTGLKVPDKPKIDKVETTDIKVGTGDPVKAGQMVSMQFFVVSCTTGAQIYSTWDQTAPDPASTTTAPGGSAPAAPPATPTGPQRLVLQAPAALQGLVDGMAGMKIGGQRQIVIPPSQGLGSAGGNLPIAGTATPSDTLIYVVQLDAFGEPAAACADSPITANTPTDPPTVGVKPDSTVPDKLVSKDVTVGQGTPIKAGDKFSAQYTGYVCSTGVKFDASWDKGTPLDGTLDASGLIQGWIDGIPGMMVGGRRVLVIPPDLAYKDQSQGAIPPNATLFFVIDLVKIG